MPKATSTTRPPARGRVLLLLVLWCGGVANAAPASTAAAVDAPSSAASTANPNEVVCKRIREVGSHIAKRVCKTRAQLEAEQSAADSALDRVRENPGAPGSMDGTAG